jgi:hypothetical protein
VCVCSACPSMELKWTEKVQNFNALMTLQLFIFFTAPTIETILLSHSCSSRAKSSERNILMTSPLGPPFCLLRAIAAALSLAAPIFLIWYLLELFKTRPFSFPVIVTFWLTFSSYRISEGAFDLSQMVWKVRKTPPLQKRKRDLRNMGNKTWQRNNLSLIFLLLQKGNRLFCLDEGGKCKRYGRRDRDFIRTITYSIIVAGVAWQEATT